MGRTLKVRYPPQRIVSLVPSQTELLYDLGLEHEVIGITKFCIHPDEWFRSKTRVGGTKKINFYVVDQLSPDLIIGNKEENEKEQIEKLTEKYPVWISDINTLEDSFWMIKEIGSLTGKEDKAAGLIEDIKNAFGALTKKTNTCPALRTLYFIWNAPYMVAGKNTFIDKMLDVCHFTNIAPSGRYPELTEDNIVSLNPELILLSSEPYPFKEKHIHQLQSLLPACKIKLVDGEMFSWYGSRLLLAPNYFKKILKDISPIT